MTKAEPSDGIPAKSGEMTNFNAVPNNSQMEVSSAHIAPGKLQGGSLPFTHVIKEMVYRQRIRIFEVAFGTFFSREDGSNKDPQ
ncbi:hypothetical protein P8452_20596 [Trifolium repens]|nr:hypothetical protein P8452_20596 [Trifolium repens]